MGKVPRQEQQNEAGLCQEQDRRGRKQPQSHKASEETVATRRSGQCPREASETGRAASLVPVLDEQKDCCWCLPYSLWYVAVPCSVRLRSPYRRDSWETDPGSNPGNISSQWRLWASKWAHVLLNPASITLLVFCEDSLAPRRAHYKVAVTSIKNALENTLCALLFLVVSNLAIIRFVN